MKNVFHCFIFNVLCMMIPSCQTPVDKNTSRLSIEAQVDNLHMQVERQTIKYREIVQLDHHRMAMKAKAKTPPAIVSIFSDDSPIISQLVTINQEIALDMPFKILAYSEPNADRPSLTYTSAEFVAKRHGMDIESLADYKEVIEGVISTLPKDLLVRPDLIKLTEDYGVIRIHSKYNYIESLGRIFKVLNILQNSDTRIFTFIDFQKEALNYGLSIRPTLLLFFGAPKPGAMAMHDAPQIGLDAFCQKMLVYEDKDGKTQVLFSNMAKLGELYYGKSNKGQQVVTKRMTMAFARVLTH
ncbi:DUF302 domain-containing protein [Halosquirtibacter laminarini]|uniref:DUF302 domain-containing protein n=1 Tax=Halosquirtibacter laminarini TaxID=3374600 RepID=A0AC61NQD5_9BACT|nr:DUF302 domain-containing protein [Prolixibacteraceae bacterium]